MILCGDREVVILIYKLYNMFLLCSTGKKKKNHFSIGYSSAAVLCYERAQLLLSPVVSLPSPSFQYNSMQHATCNINIHAIMIQPKSHNWEPISMGPLLGCLQRSVPYGKLLRHTYFSPRILISHVTCQTQKPPPDKPKPQTDAFITHNTYCNPTSTRSKET